MDKAIPRNIKIYVGCSLTHAPEEFKNDIERLRRIFRKKYTLLEFVGLVQGTPKDVFEWDTKCIKECELFVANCTYPAIGLGYELGVALEGKKPTLAVAHKDAKVTRLVLGVTHPYFTFKRYETMSEVEKMVEEKIAEMEL